jgi:hypothetical protein
MLGQEDEGEVSGEQLVMVRLEGWLWIIIMILGDFWS